SVACIEISDFTSFPEIFDGRVKTLQPKIFGGILMRREMEEDIEQARLNNIEAIDIVCVNLYPFPQVVERNDLSLEVKIENIDIGGPSLIRAAAKNYKYVSVLTQPSQYENFLAELEKGEISIATKIQLAYSAFDYTSYYDTLIANYFQKEFNLSPDSIRINYPLVQSLRYGENPHQKAYLFGEFYKYFEFLHGKELSYNNIVDVVAAVELLSDLNKFSCVIIKHTNPCGAATSNNIYDAYIKALSCDPVSAFGGIVAFNSEVDLETAKKLNEIFLEIIIAPSFSEDAISELKIKKNRRLLIQKMDFPTDGKIVKNIPSGILLQEKDNSKITGTDLKVVTKIGLDKNLIEELIFAWTICKHTKSNTIIFTRDKKILGVGAGQMSRVDSARIAAMKATENGHDLSGAVAASDAFFPFADGLNEIAKAGIKAVIQPGGSVRDEEVIQAADQNGITMVFTGIRNFKH
ncbi:MAG: bifunctional phosphoribosylaminoimidazolecarboxamide formyltransferase/inosine monophosphate cyclohydrolase, partial [Ignavibacteriales bacterium CG_4_9_14_3_um_filter_34_10]